MYQTWLKCASLLFYFSPCEHILWSQSYTYTIIMLCIVSVCIYGYGSWLYIDGYMVYLHAINCCCIDHLSTTWNDNNRNSVPKTYTATNTYRKQPYTVASNNNNRLENFLSNYIMSHDFPFYPFLCFFFHTCFLLLFMCVYFYTRYRFNIVDRKFSNHNSIAHQ